MTSNVAEKLSYPAEACFKGITVSRVNYFLAISIIYSHVSQAWPIGLESQKT